MICSILPQKRTPDTIPVKCSENFAILGAASFISCLLEVRINYNRITMISQNLTMTGTSFIWLKLRFRKVTYETFHKSI